MVIGDAYRVVEKVIIFPKIILQVEMIALV
jgi:hypothetical protein